MTAVRRRLVIFTKEPRPGRVKSRLARDIGRIDAAWWYRHQAHRLIRALAADPRWQTVLAVSPDAEGLTSRIWPPGLPRQPQGNGDLGRRMVRALRQAPGDVLVIGSDVPGITPAQVAGAFRLLNPHDVVLGPAEDGGYWAIGRRRGAVLPPHALADVRWSGPQALADTVASLGSLSVSHAAILADVDTSADLRRVGRTGRG